MGEANMLYAKNEGHVEAIGKLMEVIRLEPNMPDPYHLLGVLHEAVGNHKKGLDFYMIAAHLTPKVKELAAKTTMPFELVGAAHVEFCQY